MVIPIFSSARYDINDYLCYIVQKSWRVVCNPNERMSERAADELTLWLCDGDNFRPGR